MAEDNAKHIDIEDAAEAAEEAKVADEATSEAPEVEADEASSEASAENDNAEADAEAAEKEAEAQDSEKYLRLMAEFQNFKRRTAKEKTDIHAYANEKIIGDLLPVLDNFERALATGGSEAESFVKGMELIFTQLKTALENAGLKEIEALGQEFDPNVHNAVMTEDSEEHDDNHISKVLQKGYKLNDKVIRPSMVVVVRK